jgi:predicted FMN-binding regulatory protein PaiB
MYVPKPFAFPEGAFSELHDLIEAEGFGILVAPGDGSADPDNGLQAVHMPFVLDRGGGRYGTLAGHVARANPVWRTFASGREVLVVCQGPHCYVSPDWYATAGLVPTWNYVAVHCYGTPRIVEDVEAVIAHLAQLSARAEERLVPKRPWTLDKVKPATLTPKIQSQGQAGRSHQAFSLPVFFWLAYFSVPAIHEKEPAECPNVAAESDSHLWANSQAAPSRN